MPAESFAGRSTEEVTGEELTKESVKEEKDEDGTSVEVDCAAERCKGCK